MKTKPKPRSLFAQWSAWLPLGMSLAALALVLVYGLIIRPGPQEDEGAPARIFQLLMIAQMPIIVYFAIRFLPSRTRAALVVLALQGLAWMAAIGALLVFEQVLSRV